RPTFAHVLTLVAGTLLASGRRTVAAALRAVGLGEERQFTTYPRVLNRAAWAPLDQRPSGHDRGHPLALPDGARAQPRGRAGGAPAVPVPPHPLAGAQPRARQIPPDDPRRRPTAHLSGPALAAVPRADPRRR